MCPVCIHAQYTADVVSDAMVTAPDQVAYGERHSDHDLGHIKEWEETEEYGVKDVLPPPGRLVSVGRNAELEKGEYARDVGCIQGLPYRGPVAGIVIE